MEQSKRERVVLYGIVPLACAIIGAVLGAYANRYFVAPEGVLPAVQALNTSGMTAEQKLKALELLSKKDTEFYGFLRLLLLAASAPLAAIGYAYARRIQ